MSATILACRRDYFRILEATQRGSLDVTPWLAWFLRALKSALAEACGQIDRVLDKARYWRAHEGHRLLPAQVKVLNRLLEGGPGNFERGIGAAQYQRVARVSKATATRHLADLVNKGFLERQPGGGRSTRYRIPRADEGEFR